LKGDRAAIAAFCGGILYQTPKLDSIDSLGNAGMTEQVGKVYLVGSGPGDAAYLTLQAQAILSQAEVLVYDALVDGELINLVPDTCLKLDVGKRGGEPSTPQSEINRLIVEHCLQGKQVVRLKNGDPFIFGRAQSEIGALRKADCEFEIIPGLSSALVAPLMAGIPLTDPQLSRSFTVITAHDPDALNWVSLTKMDTLVFLMGGRTLPEIVRRLRGHGRSPETPIAIIRYAGRTEQQIWSGTLNTILDKTAETTLAPCVIVIGEVVKLRAYVGEQGEIGKQKAEARRNRQLRERAQFAERENALPEPAQEDRNPYPAIATDRNPARGSRDRAPQRPSTTNSASQPADIISPDVRPLAGKTILVTRAATQSRQFTDRLESEGARVIEMPTLEIGPPSSWRDLDRAIAHIDDFDWLILTSTNAVDAFFDRLEKVTGERAFYSNIKIAVVGEKTAQRLLRFGVQPDFVPPNFVADALVEYFPEPLAGLRILFPRVESGGREVLVKEFTSLGGKVREVAAYESRCPERIAPAALKALQAGNVDVVTFASSKTVKHFCQLLQQEDDHWQTWLRGMTITSIGPQTSQACEALLGRVDVEASEYTLDGLTQALVDWATALLEQPPETVPETIPATTPDRRPNATEPPAIATVEAPLVTSSDSIAPPATDGSIPSPASATGVTSSLMPDHAPLTAPNSLDAAVPRTRDAVLPVEPIEVAQESSTVDAPRQAQADADNIELIEVELVPDSEETGHLETLQVELDDTTTKLISAEAELIAEIQAVIHQGESDPPSK
jgi:uroporphyrinogen III methyltransferase/synthase